MSFPEQKYSAPAVAGVDAPDENLGLPIERVVGSLASVPGRLAGCALGWEDLDTFGAGVSGRGQCLVVVRS